MNRNFRKCLGAVAMMAALAPLGVSAQTLSFTGTTDQGFGIDLQIVAATPDQPAYAFFYPYEYAMRCSGGKVRYRAGAFIADVNEQADGSLRIKEWTRDARLLADVRIAPDGQTATGSFTIAQPMIRDVGRTSAFVSRCTSGKVGFTAQAAPPAAQAPR